LHRADSNGGRERLEAEPTNVLLEKTQFGVGDGDLDAIGALHAVLKANASDRRAHGFR
jgi:hypothetical protein